MPLKLKGFGFLDVQVSIGGLTRDQIACLLFSVECLLLCCFFLLKHRLMYPSLRSVTGDKRNLWMIVETSPDPTVPVLGPRDLLASNAAPSQT